MNGALANAAHVISEFAQNKYASLVAAGGLVVAPVIKEEPSRFVNFAVDGAWLFTYGTWLQLIGGLWILVLLSKELYKACRAIYDWHKNDDV